MREQTRKDLRKAKGKDPQVIRHRSEATATRIGVITEHTQLLTWAEEDRRKREQQGEEVVYCQRFEQLRRHPTEENG